MERHISVDCVTYVNLGVYIRSPGAIMIRGANDRYKRSPREFLVRNNAKTDESKASFYVSAPPVICKVAVIRSLTLIHIQCEASVCSTKMATKLDYMY